MPWGKNYQDKIPIPINHDDFPENICQFFFKINLVIYVCYAREKWDKWTSFFFYLGIKMKRQLWLSHLIKEPDWTSILVYDIIYPELQRPPPSPSHISLEHSLVVRYKYELHQAAYLFHLVACLHDISSINCSQYSDSDQTAYYFNRKLPPKMIFSPMEAWLLNYFSEAVSQPEIPLLQNGNLQNQVLFPIYLLYFSPTPSWIIIYQWHNLKK